MCRLGIIGLTILFNLILIIGVNHAQVDSLCKLSYNQFLMHPKLTEYIDVQQPDTDLLEAAIFHLTNQERIKKGEDSLKYLTKLNKVARFHSNKMRDLKFFAHENKKELEYYSVYKRYKHFGISRDGGENILKGSVERLNGRTYEKEMSQKNNGMYRYYRKYLFMKFYLYNYTYMELAKSSVDAWMKSRGHRDNILSDGYKYLGVGVSFEYKKKGFSPVFATQNFL